MIHIGIYGYGNLGRGVEYAVSKAPDMELKAIFTRRDPATVHPHTNTPVYKAEDAPSMKDQIDVMILCGGSATDLPEMTPALGHLFNVVDSFDTHAHIPQHFAAVDKACKEAGTVGLISVGWDPGLFSLNRAYASSILPDGSYYTFWGKGVSQGHSDAIRRIPGVLDARQYTVPVPEAVERVRAGENPTLTVREKHKRECFVVAAEDADKDAIREAIVTMPAYFADYDTTVTFITMDELRRDHAGLPHGGSVIRTGRTGKDDAHTEVFEFSLKLDSNPEFTGSVLAAFARAVKRMADRGDKGCKTVLDIAPVDVSPIPREELIAHRL